MLDFLNISLVVSLACVDSTLGVSPVYASVAEVKWEREMATFEFLRLSLSIPAIGPLDNSDQREPTETRQQYLKDIFSERHDFFHRKSLFSFVPAINEALPNGVLAGFMGRQIRELENAGPENLFALVPHKTWKAAFITIDTNPEEQVVAVERRQDVGSSHSIIENFIDSRMRERKSLSWHTDVEYITGTEAFWKAVERHKGEITDLSFTFYPANGLKGFDKFKEFDRIAKDQTNSEKSEYSLKNPKGGVNPDGDFVDSALDYAGEGAGQTTMKVGRKKVFDSRQSKETETLPESLMPREGEPAKVAGAAEHLKKSRAKKKKAKKKDG